MIAKRKKRGRAFWTMIALAVLLIGYPLSFGPACWIASRGADGDLHDLYLPLGWVMERSAKPIGSTISAYGTFGMPPDTAVAVPIGANRYRVIFTDPLPGASRIRLPAPESPRP